MLDKHHLTILVAIAQHKTLTEAAKQLNLTQSALSHSIHKLEAYFNVSLWVKNGRHIVLTDAGNYLLNFAQRLLPQFDYAEHMLTAFATGERGLLRLGMECHPCYRWLQKRLPPFLQRWPDIDVDVKQKFQFGGIAALLQYDIDLLITPDPIAHTDIKFIAMFPYELVLVTSTAHALANTPIITPHHLLNEVLYTYPVPIERLDIYNQFLLPAQCLPLKHKTIETIDMMLHMIAANRGVGALPSWFVAEYPQLPLSTNRLGNNGVHKHIYVGYRVNEVSPIVEAFINALQSPING